MSIFNLGSINADHTYRVPHLPAPGETLVAQSLVTGLGGKGANQSVAAARAGARVMHMGAVGRDGGWAIEKLASFGVGIGGICRLDEPTGHAIINVDEMGENEIVVFSGANKKQSLPAILETLSAAHGGDILMLQNETDLQVEAAVAARKKGLMVIYSAAPFDAEAVRNIARYADLLVMNEGEYATLKAALGDMPLPDRLITRGARGSSWISADGITETPAFPVTAVDTTGAGDCFVGTLAAGLDLGMPRQKALRLAAAASALQVTRPGTAAAIPSRAEVDAFLEAHS